METQIEQEGVQLRPAFITVLVVDDEVSARNLCSDVAAKAGLRVRTTATTEQALEELEQYPIDIVITDLRVPQLGDWSCSNAYAAATRKLRSWC